MTRAEATDVRLIDWKGDGETAILAAAIHPHAGIPLADLRRRVQQNAGLGAHRNDANAGRRPPQPPHRPGRALEHTDYTFDITADYGAFRDLQRHRMPTIDWQSAHDQPRG